MVLPREPLVSVATSPVVADADGSGLLGGGVFVAAVFVAADDVVSVSDALVFVNVEDGVLVPGFVVAEPPHAAATRPKNSTATCAARGYRETLRITRFWPRGPRPAAGAPDTPWYTRGDMTYVVTETCIDLKDKSCIEVCPVDCIHEADEDRMVFIDPDECIDCGACVDPCPVDAIYAEEDVPSAQVSFVDINKVYFKDKGEARTKVDGLKAPAA